MVRRESSSRALLLVFASALFGQAFGQSSNYSYPPIDPKAYPNMMRASSPETARLIYGGRVDPRWTDGGNSFWFKRRVPNGSEFYVVDTVRAIKRSAFDKDAVANAIQSQLGRSVAAAELPIQNLAIQQGKTYLRITGEKGGWFRWDAAKKSLIAEEPKIDATTGESAPQETKPTAPNRSRSVVTLRENNVFLSTNSGEKQLTTDGTRDFGFQEIWASPDGQSAVIAKVQRPRVSTMTNIEALPAAALEKEFHKDETAPGESLRARIITYPYELPGDPTTTRELYAFSSKTGELKKLDYPTITMWGLDSPTWLPSGELAFYHTMRGFQSRTAVAIDPAKSKPRILTEIRSKTFVYPPIQIFRIVYGGRVLLWTDDRSGYNHLYAVEIATGKTIALTKGDWVFRNLVEVDEKTGEILFEAGGFNPEYDPYQKQTFRIKFDEKAFKVSEPLNLTPGNGEHSIRFTEDKKFYFDTYSRPDLPPVTELRRTKDGSLVVEVDRADAAPWLAAGYKMPQVFKAKARDGKTDIWGVVYRPANFDPTKKYPVIEDIYAGPQGSFVPKTWSASNGMHSLAQLGFVVVKIDGMGTANRSKAFHEVCYKNLGDGGFPDRILWMRALAATDPAVDITRVGVYGTSAGGYNAARALIGFNEFYKVAVADCGNHDHRTDKTWWNEMWMGYPVGPHYAEQSNIVQAGKLKGKLLLMHGELDNNVNPSVSSLQLSTMLQRANKDFDLVIAGNAGHGMGLYGRRRMIDHFVRHLRNETPPTEFSLSVEAAGRIIVTFKNTTKQTIDVCWEQGPGEYVKYQTLKPGDSAQQNTFDGHAWVAMMNGKVIGRWVAAADDLEWEIGG